MYKLLQEKTEFRGFAVRKNTAFKFC